MNIKNILRFIYWDAIPIVTGGVVFYYLNKIQDPWDYMKAWMAFLGVAIPFMIIHIWIGHKIFPEKMTLADKIMKCGLRMQYGRDYCVKCPDSYNCAAGIEGGKGGNV